MGSNAATVGNRAGKPCFAFTDVGQDSGPIGFGEAPGHYKARTFHLVGDGVGMAVKLYGTLDVNTAQGLADNWGVLPAESTQANAAWANPLTTDETSCLYYVSAPFVAVRAVSEADGSGNPVSGSVQLLMFAAP